MFINLRILVRIVNERERFGQNGIESDVCYRGKKFVGELGYCYCNDKKENEEQGRIHGQSVVAAGGQGQ